MLQLCKREFLGRRANTLLIDLVSLLSGAASRNRSAEREGEWRGPEGINHG